MCIHRFRDSFLEEWPRSDIVDYEPSTVAQRPALPPPLITIHCLFFFSLQHEESECLIIPDNHFCLSCQYSVRFMRLCGKRSACISRAPYQLGRCSPTQPPPCDGLSCSAASGPERGIITPCPSAGCFLGLVRITWSPHRARCAPT